MNGSVSWPDALLGGDRVASLPAHLTTRLHDRAECASLDRVPDFNTATTHK
jgi:hypothetical protein